MTVIWNLTGFASKDALAIYRAHYLQSVLLESLANRQYIRQGEILGNISTYINSEISWEATAFDVNDALKHLLLIEMIQSNNDNNIAITALGITALQDCRFQQLASTAFFNYRNLKNTQLMIQFSTISLLISVIALIVSVFKH